MSKVYLLLGFGVSNKNILRFLLALRKKIIIYDDNPKIKIPKQYRVDESNIPYERIRRVIISPGIRPDNPMVQKLLKAKVEIITDMDFLYLYNKRKNRKAYYIGITGSNGKTTTVNFLHQLLNMNNTLCGNVGLSLFQHIKRKKYFIYVMEISSFQLHYMKHLILDISLITNIESNHDQWHGSFEVYKNTKLSISERSKIFIDQNWKNSWKINNNLLLYKDHPKLVIDNKIFKMEHNQMNLINSLEVIIEVYKQFNRTAGQIKLSKVNQLVVPPYRQEIIYESNNLMIINDSKSTNLSSTFTAVKNCKKMDGEITLLMGGLIKGELSLIPNITLIVDKVFLFGASAKDIHIINNIPVDKCEIYGSLNMAIVRLINNINNTKQKFVILFSPGGASYDEFNNYEERGRFFTDRIRSLLI